MADPETYVRSRLFMDRGLELGNSEDRWIRRALHVLIGNKDTDPVPVNIVGANGGTNTYFDFDATTTVGTLQTLVNYTVPVGKRLVLYRAKVSCRITGEYLVKSDSDLIASGNLNEAHPSDFFKWDRPRELSAGTILKLEFTASTDNPNVAVRGHIQAALFDTP